MVNKLTVRQSMVNPCSALFVEVTELKQYLILCRSVTSAQRCARLLQSSLIRASVTKAPSGLTKAGCTYALLLHGKLENALSLLRSNQMPFGKAFSREDRGEWIEVQA